MGRGGGKGWREGMMGRDDGKGWSDTGKVYEGLPMSRGGGGALGSAKDGSVLMTSRVRPSATLLSRYPRATIRIHYSTSIHYLMRPYK